MNIKVKKSQAEVYTIRFLEHRDWWIQDRGYLALNTSQGDWTHTWSSTGCLFKEFLTQLDSSYLMDKLGGLRDCFNGDASFLQIKRDVLECRRDAGITAEEAREIWDCFDYHLDCSSEINYWRSLDDLPDVFHKKIYYYDYSAIPCIKEHDSSLQLFVKDMWPGFVQALRYGEDTCSQRCFDAMVRSTTSQ